MYSASAQITTDGSTKTTLTPTNNGVRIDDGDLAGGNLFHSFGEFSVPNGSEAFFNNATDIVNIFSRVTGGNISNIDGLIRANGAANLFLINPHGIIFGNNASLLLGGSFYGSTADSILFPDGVEFTATNTQRPVLTINAPIGLNLRNNPGEIVNRSVVQNNAGDAVGLEVAPGSTLSLVGGNISFEAGEATAPGGRIELGGLEDGGTVTLNNDGSLSFPLDVGRADISLSNASDIDVTGTDGGSITINGGNVSLSAGDFGESQIRAGITADSTSTEAKAGDITINATNNVTVDQSIILNDVEPNAVGNAGEVSIDTTNLTLTNGGQIISITLGIGDAGNIIINARDTISLDGERSSGFPTVIASTVEPNAVGNAGEVSIDTTNLSLTNGGQIISSTLGRGDAGNIIINARDTISLDGERSLGLPTAIASTVEPNAVGNAGEVSIDTTNLTLTNGGQIIGSTLGRGDAGNIIINARDTISLDGERSSGFSAAIASTVESNAVGNAGEVSIDTTNLSLTNGGQISSATFAEGNANTVTINASDSMELDGSSPTGRSGLFTSSIQGSSEGGDIKIFTDELKISNGATISAGNFQSLGLASPGTGEPGSINIQANSLNLNNEARIVAATQAETDELSANINLKIADEIVLRDNSFISARAFNNTDGGNLTIDTNFIIAFPSSGNGNDIIASAEQGDGGNINITAEALLGLEEGQAILGNRTNDIDASSEFGLDGDITFNVPDTNKFQETLILPDQPLNAQISTLCNPGTSEFIVVGRGGITPNTLETLNINPIPPDWVELPQKHNNSSKPSFSSISHSLPTPQIVEATGWIINENGKVELVADVNNVAGYNSWQKPRQCTNN
ncbi:MAG: filamentous hemagglutinin N-terminal domain-containing protein [Xenococcaceae cyanobacterium MO_167.B27]|nr:filamentous hemagglutinin N-terminal domain-containing protein [Xenococcaceae cyanobacterium MO_167.B27]